jgi:hypothetical protein
MWKGGIAMAHAKFKDAIMKELEDMPDDEIPKLIELISDLKADLKAGKKEKMNKGRDPLFGLREIAVETGIKDLAENHDRYLYGAEE